MAEIGRPVSTVTRHRRQGVLPRGCFSSTFPNTTNLWRLLGGGHYDQNIWENRSTYIYAKLWWKSERIRCNRENKTRSFHVTDINRAILKWRMNLIFFTHRFQSKTALVYLWSGKGSIASTWLGIPLGKQLDKSSQNLCKFTRLCFKSPLMPVRKRWLAQLAMFKFHRTPLCFESIVAIKRLPTERKNNEFKIVYFIFYMFTLFTFI